MSSFICEKCGCIDNTACGGTYWEVGKYGRKNKEDNFKEEFFNKHPVCVACKPTEYIDGSKDDRAGKWHDKFERNHWSELYRDLHELTLATSERTGDMINARTYVKQVKKGRLQESLTKSW